MSQYADKAHQMPVVMQRGRGEWTSTCLCVCVCVCTLYSCGTERMTQSHSVLHFIRIKNSDWPFYCPRLQATAISRKREREGEGRKEKERDI